MCALLRYTAADRGSLELSHHQTAALPHTATPAYSETMQHLPDRRRFELSHTAITTDI
jgi:hypothetical protein